MIIFEENSRFAYRDPACCRFNGVYYLFFHGSRDVFRETHGNATLAIAFTDDFETYYY